MTRRREYYALKPVTMTWRQGGAYALLGPSGCGKTTLLNLISGLRHAVARADPVRRHRRHAGHDAEAQHRAGVPVPGHLRHHDGRREPGLPAAQPRRAAEPRSTRASKQVAELLELTPYLNRKATRLTADAKQKISLGRGLVRSDVAAVLFDEPLTVIDPHLKWLLRSQAEGSCTASST